jgi:hypothetical protein
MLAPLTGLVSLIVKYKRGPEQRKDFDEIKKKVSKETLLALADFEKRISCVYLCIQQAIGSSHYTRKKTASFL